MSETTLPPSPLGTLIESPCVRICDIDKSSGLCRGCLRTMKEITDWRRMTDSERRSVMADLENRAVA